MTKRFLTLALAAFLLASVPAFAQEKGVLFTAAPTADKVYPQVSAYESGVEVTTKWPSVVTLTRMHVADKPLDQSWLNYTADVQAVNIVGKAYLEMWLHFKDKGFFFSRGLDKPIEKDSGWMPLSTPFVLKKGEQPDEIILNVRVEGSGTVRIRNAMLSYVRGEAPKDVEKAAEKAEQKQPEDAKEEPEAERKAKEEEKKE